MAALSTTDILNIKTSIENGHFSGDYATDDLNKNLELPFYLYLQHWKTGEFLFTEINEAFVRFHFANPRYINKGNIIKKIHSQNYRIIVESPNKVDIFKELKKRYEKLLLAKRELDIITQLFSEHPEYVV